MSVRTQLKFMAGVGSVQKCSNGPAQNFLNNLKNLQRPLQLIFAKTMLVTTVIFSFTCDKFLGTPKTRQIWYQKGACVRAEKIVDFGLFGAHTWKIWECHTRHTKNFIFYAHEQGTPSASGARCTLLFESVLLSKIMNGVHCQKARYT